MASDELHLPDGYDNEALMRAFEAFTDVVPDMGGVQVVLTSTFEQSVRENLDDPEYAAAYRQDRGQFGRAMAKTIPQADGSVTVVVDASLFWTDAWNPGVPEKTLTHEGFHVALHQRQESLFDAGIRSGLGSAERFYLASAGIACEEFRVELAVGPQREGQYNGFAALLRAFDERLLHLSAEYQETLDVETISREVMESFHAVVTACGYIAATMENEGVSLPPIDAGLDARVFGAPGRAVIDLLHVLPSAGTPTPADELKSAAEDVARAIHSWIVAIGFEWEDVEEGLHFHVLKAEQWWRRGLRAGVVS